MMSNSMILVYVSFEFNYVTMSFRNKSGTNFGGVLLLNVLGSIIPMSIWVNLLDFLKKIGTNLGHFLQ